MPAPLGLLTRPLPQPPRALRRGPFRAGAFPSRLRDPVATARIGRWLGIAVAVCLGTGLISHWAQQPPGRFALPPGITWGYRVSQGVHVGTGIACVPLLLVKLWTVYPRLWSWPPARSVLHALERLSVLVLVASAVFELASGLANIAQWYPWRFYFPRAHEAVAWIAAGSILLHVAVKLPVITAALSGGGAPAPPAGPPGGGIRADPVSPDTPAAGPVASAPPPAPDGPAGVARSGPDPGGAGGGGMTRRGLFVATGAAVAAVTVTTVGQTVAPLRRLAVLAPRRPDIGPQRLPVNRTAAQAGIAAIGPGYRLTVGGPRPFTLSLAELRALPQYLAELPIACVEGWSASGRWVGVRVRELLDRAGAPATAAARVTSLERQGIYTSSLLSPAHAAHPLTLLALELNGAPLSLDHGAPVRLIAPDRPGVLQTKWVSRVDML